jgi:hypothetical protein
MPAVKFFKRIDLNQTSLFLDGQKVKRSLHDTRKSVINSPYAFLAVCDAEMAADPISTAGGAGCAPGDEPARFFFCFIGK